MKNIRFITDRAALPRFSRTRHLEPRTSKAPAVRIAYLTSVYPAVSHTFIIREVQALRKQGVGVDTFSIRRPPAEQPISAQDTKEQDATYYILPPRWPRLFAAHLSALSSRPLRFLAAFHFALATHPGGMHSLLWHFFYFVEGVLLWHELNRRGIAHIHVHFGMACATVVMIASQLGDFSYSMTLHGPTVFYDTSRFLLREKVQRAMLVFCISAFCRSQVMVHVPPEHWQKLHIVHCGVDTGAYSFAGPRAAASGGPRLLCIGRLVPEKAQAILLHMIARLRGDYPTINCTLVGDGPDRTRLEALAQRLGIRDRLSFVGSVSQEDIPTYLEQSDVFVLPSFAEGLPVVLMEAMAKGLPVVTTYIAGIPELVRDHETGLLAPSGDVEALTTAVREILEDPKLRDRLALSAREKVLKEFDINQIGDRLARIFGTQLASQGRADGNEAG